MNQIVPVEPIVAQTKRQPATMLMPKRDRQISVSLTRAQLREIRLAAARAELTPAGLVRAALRAYMRDKLGMRFPCETEC